MITLSKLLSHSVMYMMFTPWNQQIDGNIIQEDNQAFGIVLRTHYSRLYLACIIRRVLLLIT